MTNQIVFTTLEQTLKEACTVGQTEQRHWKTNTFVVDKTKHGESKRKLIRLIAVHERNPEIDMLVKLVKSIQRPSFKIVWSP